ncbi:hypothetical protein [Marinomonas mediterranea]|uniref:hypothetical protein n=1 Tax=Marinomonas mediterranea TaxID=119864 RepID=UPI00234B1692|nr:hypothetical protein [Marinomonas mediterranea]WCN10715.1 hypothetical protein GV055_18180 [Marinomonas mediterranea]WCN14771.1 hypothetical protein GV054_18050 [Marinomonas mediterranea]
MDLTNIDSKLLIGVMTPILLAVGYFYRARKESIKNRKIALYILLEIWHRISVFYRKDFDDVFEQIIKEIKRQFPTENISESEICASKAYFTPILIEAARGIALSDLDSYQEKYQEAVSLISSDDPIFAYKISSASKTKKFLKFLDSYLERSLAPIEESEIGSMLSQSLKSHMTKHAELDSIKDLESDIRRLSLKVGVFTFFSSAYIIRKRRSNLATIESREVENLVANVLAPAMTEFNKSIQETANASVD